MISISPTIKCSAWLSSKQELMETEPRKVIINLAAFNNGWHSNGLALGEVDIGMTYQAE